MQRGVAGMIVGFWLIAAGVLASPQVFGPDNRALDGATVVADAGTFWVRNGVNLPVLLTPNADDDLRFPDLAIARLLVLDSVTGKPVPSGDLRWSGPDIPESISTITWSARDGRLDLGCRGGESVEMSAVGYRPLIVTLEPQSRRNTILLEPFGDLRISVKPPSEGRLWLADDRDISVISPFHSAAERHEIDDGGSIVIRDLDADTEYQGIVVVPGRTPVVGRIGGLPKHLELTLEPGLAVAGRVLDRTGEPVADGRVRATGAIETLGGFRYRQEMRTDSEGRYTITGLLAGEITIKACAPDHACDEAVVEIADGTETEPVDFRLTSGHDLRLTIQNETGRPAAGATVIDTVAFRKHETDDDGVLIFEGVRSGSILELEVFGAGLRRWQGSIDIDRPEIVLRIPAGGVLSWPILTHRALAPDEVVATWSRLNSQGREIAEGFAVWDAGHELVRADGLDAGPHRLQVRLPGAATLRSEVVEIGPGEELYLAPVVPDAGLAVSGRVLVGATAQPLAGARVSCEPGSPNQFRKPHRLERLQSTLTDADGVFLLEGLDPGSCRAVIRAPGFAPWRRDGVEPDQAGVDLGDIELDLALVLATPVATWAAWRDDPARADRLHFIAVERHPFSADDLRRAHARWPELGELASGLHAHWPALTPGMHRLWLDGGRVALTLAMTPFISMVSRPPVIPNYGQRVCAISSPRLPSTTPRWRPGRLRGKSAGTSNMRAGMSRARPDSVTSATCCAHGIAGKALTTRRAASGRPSCSVQDLLAPAWRSAWRRADGRSGLSMAARLRATAPRATTSAFCGPIRASTTIAWRASAVPARSPQCIISRHWSTPGIRCAGPPRASCTSRAMQSTKHASARSSKRNNRPLTFCVSSRLPKRRSSPAGPSPRVAGGFLPAGGCNRLRCALRISRQQASRHASTHVSSASKSVAKPGG